MLTSVSMCITVDILQYSMPLAFLPSVLEDRGHSTEKIATAIGVYYWTGLLGGIMITSYEVWRMLYVRDTHKLDITPFPTVQRQIKIIIVSLGIGVVSLFIQAYSPRMHVHTAARFVQGFVGAFLFFYVFLLNVAIFRGQQLVVAMTFASSATVVAELAGPLLGSVLFDAYGQQSVFAFLGVISFINQLMLVGVLYTIKPTEDVASESSSPMLAAAHPSAAVDEPRQDRWYSFLMPYPEAWAKLTTLLRNPTFICAVLIITMAGVIKGSVEEMLPFHADHQWGYDPVAIGKLFCTTAVAYLIASALVAETWVRMGRFQTIFSSNCILLLGATTWMCFHVAYYFKDDRALYGTFAAYGFCAGLAFTSAAQLIAEVVDKAEGHAKDAANGIWNTMWEAGGSTGFALGGFLAHHYADQMKLTNLFFMCAVLTAACMTAVGYAGGKCSKDVAGKMDKSLEYGATA